MGIHPAYIVSAKDRATGKAIVPLPTAEGLTEISNELGRACQLAWASSSSGEPPAATHPVAGDPVVPLVGAACHNPAVPSVGAALHNPVIPSFGAASITLLSHPLELLHHPHSHLNQRRSGQRQRCLSPISNAAFNGQRSKSFDTSIVSGTVAELLHPA